MVSGAIPEVPLDSDSQNSAVVFPIAEITPIPVTTTRRMGEGLRNRRATERGGRPRDQALDAARQLTQAARRVHAVVGQAHVELVLEGENEAEGVQGILADLVQGLVERHRLQGNLVDGRYDPADLFVPFL